MEVSDRFGEDLKSGIFLIEKSLKVEIYFARTDFVELISSVDDNKNLWPIL